MSIVPLLSMIGIQLIVTVVVMTAWLISSGFTGMTQTYTENSIVLVVWMHVFTLAVMGLWYYLYVVRRQKKQEFPLRENSAGRV